MCAPQRRLIPLDDPSEPDVAQIREPQLPLRGSEQFILGRVRHHDPLHVLREAPRRRLLAGDKHVPGFPDRARVRAERGLDEESVRRVFGDERAKRVDPVEETEGCRPSDELVDRRTDEGVGDVATDEVGEDMRATRVSDEYDVPDLGPGAPIADEVREAPGYILYVRRMNDGGPRRVVRMRGESVVGYDDGREREEGGLPSCVMLVC